MSQEQIDILIRKCISGQATLADRQRLVELAGDHSHKAVFEHSLDKAWEEVKAEPVFQDAGQEQLLDYILAKEPVHRIHFLKTTWFRYAAILLLIAGTIWWLRHPGRRTPEDTLADMTRPGSLASPSNDLPPGTTKATLTLADGTTITLDSTANGSIAQQGNTEITKLSNGELRYDAKGMMQGETLLNTMSTPVGGQYQLMLPDGTKVWLNAMSSITYPVVFAGNAREVTVTGEVYFEVAQNKRQPFLVNTDGKSWVEVLGTSFNINAYQDEPAVRTTLITGKVNVRKENSAQVLQPGQQAITGEKIQLNAHADTEQVLAWKNGVFNLHDKTLEEVMRQIVRWYNVKVVYPPALAGKKFGGEMGRDLTLVQVLELLDGPGMHFTLEGRTIKVQP